MSKYLGQLLKKLKVPNYENVKYELLHSNFEIFNISEEMVGGKTNDEVIEYTYKYDKKYYDFNIHVVRSAGRITYAVHNFDKWDKTEYCTFIVYDTVGKNCYIENINYYEKCCVGQIHSPSGSILLKFTIDFIKKYIAKKYVVKFIQLRDISKKRCDFVDDTIDLGLFYMFVHGNTWYGRYGFVPFNPSQEKTNESLLKIYKNNQTIVSTTLVKDTNIGKYIVEAIKKYKLKINIEQMNGVIKKYGNMSVMKCMKHLMAFYDKNCAIFYYMYPKLVADLDMVDLYGTSYWMKL